MFLTYRHYRRKNLKAGSVIDQLRYVNKYHKHFCFQVIYFLYTCNIPEKSKSENLSEKDLSIKDQYMINIIIDSDYILFTRM